MKSKKLVSAAIALALILGGNSALASTPINKQVKIASADFEYSKEAQEALAYLNDIRQKAGLMEVKLNPYLTKSAQNHADYIATNGVSSSHSETEGEEGFTGTDVRARVTAVGAPYELTQLIDEGIDYSTSSFTEAIDQLLNSAYHRTPLMTSILSDIGLGIDGTTIVFNYGNLQPTRSNSIYPYDGQTNVGLSFYGETETPNPLTKFGVSKSGFIISINLARLVDTKKIDATITNSKGEKIPFNSLWDTEWFFFPKSELAYNETYTVSVNYIPKSGTEIGVQKNKTWSFTTMKKPGSTIPTPAPKPTPSGSIPGSTHTPSKFNKDNVGVKINNALVKLTPTAIIVNGSTFIPLRGVFENLGSEIGWDQSTKTVTITRGDTEVKLTIGSKTAYINGKKTTLAIAPFIAPSGSTYVPLRFASESIGVDVSWDQANYIAIIESI
jgi:uncharacterized protein YkwD